MKRRFPPGWHLRRARIPEAAVAKLGALFEMGLLQTAAVALVLGVALRFVRRCLSRVPVAPVLRGDTG